MPDAPAPPACATPAVVLDTNAALDWLAFADPRIAPLVVAIESGRVRWIGTAPMRDELAEVARRPNLIARIGRCEHILTAFDRWAVLVAPAPRAGLQFTCADADDQMFIDLAVSEGARWLVTRDKALLALRAKALKQDLTIAEPAAWRPDG